MTMRAVPGTEGRPAVVAAVTVTQGGNGVGGSHVAGALEQGQCPGTEAAGVPRRGAGPGWDVPARKASPGERGKPWPRGAGGQGARAYLSPEPCLTWQAAHGHEIKA